MSKSLRIPTKIGKDQTINFQMDQEFDFLEILSLKIQSEDIYTRNCADYGVVVGRITANGGYGLPNVKVSVFLPLTDADAENEVISTLYPYVSTSTLNEDGYRYNLLPYEKSYSTHVPTGTFPTRSDILKDPTVGQIYQKYFKFTVKTNESGDYMIMGVPLGNQTVFMDLDLSDIGEFSLTPQDLIRVGRANENQFNGNKFKASADLQTLPQIVSLQTNIEVSPLWGQPDVCQISINRVDFDLRADANIDILPTAVFMGSVVSANDRRVLKKNCRPATEGGDLCGLIVGPGEVLCVRQTIGQDVDGRPVLEEFEFAGGSKVIDENGTWLVDVPMNLDYLVTNEFGERVISIDPRVGIPTKGRYRFKVKWEQSPDLGQQVKRAFYLVPNIREYGWNNPDSDPINFSKSSTQYKELQRSYAFSLDWNDYGDTGTTIGNQMIDSAIDCVDKFYEMTYNKVYTVAGFIDGYHNGANRGRFIGIKEIQDTSCDSENNRFPTNDAVKNFDLIFIIFNFLISFITLILIPLIPVVHIVAFIWPILRLLLTFVFGFLVLLVFSICSVLSAITFRAIKCKKPPSFGDIWNAIGDPFKNIAMPVITYPDCELCNCDPKAVEENEDTKKFVTEAIAATSFTFLGDTPNATTYVNIFDPAYCQNDPEWVFATSPLSLLNRGTLCEEQTTKNTFLNSQNLIQTIVAGSNRDAVGQRMGMSTFIEGNPQANFDLTLTERLNLFNFKGQYFNKFGGWNQVKVKVASDNPANSQSFHYDNTITILVDAQRISDFTTGRLITFQNPDLSSDPNTSLAAVNFSGFSSSTGTAKNLGSIVVNYADPNNPDSTLQTSYLVTQKPDAVETCYIGEVIVPSGQEWFFTDCDGVYKSGSEKPSGKFCISNVYPKQGVFLTDQKCGAEKNLCYTKFKSDIEYFQVVTGMTFSTFQSLNPPMSGKKSLYERYISGINFIWREISVSMFAYWGLVNAFRPFYAIDEFNNYGVIILQRGVDPNSTRQTTTIDISRICGKDYGTVLVSSKYKLNIPIQSGLQLPRHNQISDNESTSVGKPIYFDSYLFKPGTNYSGYTSNMPSHYSSLDSSIVGNDGYIVDQDVPLSRLDGPKVSVSSNYLTANKSNNVIAQDQYPVFDQPIFSFPFIIQNNLDVFKKYYSQYGGKKMLGYWENEYIEGGSYFFLNKGESIESKKPSFRFDRFVYFSPAYPETLQMKVLPQTEKIVMRTDRLPTSTSRTGYKNNSYQLHQNTNFSINFVSDEGDVVSYPNEGAVFSANEQYDANSEFEEQYLSAFSCQGLVPISCYSGDSESFGIYPKDNDCYKSATVENGCYIFVKKPIATLLKDINQLAEWKMRLRISFAACRGVFGHSFLNNWVNGVLYHFPFRNVRFFTSPRSANPNQPYNLFCNSVIVFHDQTNNFYYRSSPWAADPSSPNYGGSFIGKGRTGKEARNKKEILFPTTITNLGPRDVFTSELSLSADFFGYNMVNYPTSTFQDVADILNLFIISRQLNSTWLKNMTNTKEGSIDQFFSREKQKVDGDYAQMISINSELGVQGFNFDSYNAASGKSVNNPFYVGQDRRDGPVVGIFFSGDSQIRDYLTPRRIIRNDQLNYNQAIYDYLGVSDQLVPFYSWETKDSSNIFGTQENDWLTTQITSRNYQSLNRTDVTSNYFMGENPLAEFMKGYIYNRSLVANADGTFNYEGDKTLSYRPINNNKYFSVGLPFHFYFGLKVGASALNRFYKKYI